MTFSRERSMWMLFEPIHVVTYFAPESREALTAAGLRGFWRGYFAGRAAPLGAVSAPPVIASFFSFAPSMVTRALPAVWALADPSRTLAARVDGAVASLAALLPDIPDHHVREAVDLVERAVAALEPAGRVLGAANAALPPYEQPFARLWQGTTTLREHRGDGHVAALVAAGVGPCEALAMRCGMDLSREQVQPARGWADEDWSAAQARLTARGLLDSDGKITPQGLDLFRSVEAATDLAAAGPWDEMGPHATTRLTELLEPMAAACITAVPPTNPIGLPR